MLMAGASGWLGLNRVNRTIYSLEISGRRPRLQMRYRHARVGRIEWEVGGDPIRDRADFFFSFRDLEGQNARRSRLGEIDFL